MFYINRIPSLDDFGDLDLREEDKRELGILGKDWRTAFAEAVQVSRFVYTIELNGEVLVVVGIKEESDDIGSPWAVAVKDAMFPTNLNACLALSYKIISVMQERYSVLAGGVDVRNEGHIRWLKAVGFTVQTENPIHLVAGSVYPFYKVRS